MRYHISIIHFQFQFNCMFAGRWGNTVCGGESIAVNSAQCVTCAVKSCRPPIVNSGLHALSTLAHLLYTILCMHC